MIGLLLDFKPWTDFKQWVSVEWSDTVFALVLCILGICIAGVLLTFFKKAVNKGKLKWANIVLIIILGGLIALFAFARY